MSDDPINFLVRPVDRYQTYHDVNGHHLAIEWTTGRDTVRIVLPHEELPRLARQILHAIGVLAANRGEPNPLGAEAFANDLGEGPL